MKTSQLRALASKAGYQLDAETEAFFRLVEHSMRKDIRKKLLDFEDFLDNQGMKQEANMAWVCSLLVKEGVDQDMAIYIKHLTAEA